MIDATAAAKFADDLRNARHDDLGGAADLIMELVTENWQLRGALGYPVPADIPEGPFRCGFCQAHRERKFRETFFW